MSFSPRLWFTINNQDRSINGWTARETTMKKGPHKNLERFQFFSARRKCKERWRKQKAKELWRRNCECFITNCRAVRMVLNDLFLLFRFVFLFHKSEMKSLVVINGRHQTMFRRTLWSALSLNSRKVFHVFQEHLNDHPCCWINTEWLLDIGLGRKSIKITSKWECSRQW